MRLTLLQTTDSAQIKIAKFRMFDNHIAGKQGNGIIVKAILGALLSHDAVAEIIPYYMCANMPKLSKQLICNPTGFLNDGRICRKLIFQKRSTHFAYFVECFGSELLVRCEQTGRLNLCLVPFFRTTNFGFS